MDDFSVIDFLGIALVAVIAVLLLALPFIRFETSEQNVSGIVYNVKNNAFITGNTSFSVRAAVDTVTTEENKSSYCLPPNSPYIELVNKAAENKNIKVSVKTEKMFRIMLPFQCADNVTVTEVKEN